MSKGDACDARFQSAEALQYYLPAEKLEPENVRILVRIARQYRHLMADAAPRQEKLRLGECCAGLFAASSGAGPE